MVTIRYDSPTPAPEDILLVLQEFTPKHRRSRIATPARILHDLLIIGDEFHSLMVRLDPDKRIDFSEFCVDEFIPSELSWDAFLISLLGRFDAEASITKKYKPFLASDLIRLRAGEPWGQVRGNR